MTTPEPLRLPDEALHIARLVAAEFDRHREHVRREFAAEAAAKIRELKMTTTGGDGRVAVFNRAVEACARVVERLAEQRPGGDVTP